MRKIIRIGSKEKKKITNKEEFLSCDLEARVALIQALIPAGQEKVAEDLAQEVEYLAEGSTVVMGKWMRIIAEAATIDLFIRTEDKH